MVLLVEGGGVNQVESKGRGWKCNQRQIGVLLTQAVKKGGRRSKLCLLLAALPFSVPQFAPYNVKLGLGLYIAYLFSSF